MSSGGSPVRVARVVAVAVTLRDRREQLSSGYLSGGRMVLTAEHCTRDKVTGEPAARLRVVRASDGAEAQVVGVVPDHGLDVAVLRLAEDAPWDSSLPPPAFARVDQSQSGVLDDCAGIGFALFQRDPARRTRHTSEFHGKVYQTDERESGRLLMREPLIYPGPITGLEGEILSDRGEHGPSPWGGLSGALMFYRGSAIGVVVEHHPRQGGNALRAVGFERIAANAEIRQCLGLPGPDSLPFVSEYVAVQSALVGGMLVSDADPRRLGVHAVISVPGVPDDVPPEYVPRDVDAVESGVRAKVAAAAQRGGFVLLVGGSSVGKTRCAVEAVKGLLPDWWLVHPADPDQVAALAEVPSPRTVVWLDELQDYLDGEHGLTGGVVRALLNAPHSAVIIGTLWPDRYAAYTTLPKSGGADLHARARAVLNLAEIIRISAEFSPAEQVRARAAATRDRRLAVGLGTAGYGLTQTLASAPQIVARWENARDTDPYAWGVLAAAADAARLGARAPLNPGLLRAAAPGYCTSQQQAEAPENWFEQALVYTTGKLNGAVAVLSPVGGGMGQVAGYTVADYLIQHASWERRYARVPASTWDAMVSHIRDPADAARIADSAMYRLMYCYAIPLYRLAADVGDGHAARQLATLLAARGDLDELRVRAADDRYAAEDLARMLANRGDLGGPAQTLRAQADSGDEHAARQLAKLRGRVESRVQAVIDRGQLAVRQVVRLADLLAERGQLDEAAQILRARADSGDEHAAGQLAGLLAERAIWARLRLWADADDMDATDLLAERGDFAKLHARADTGDEYAISLLAVRLSWYLAERSDLDGLRARAEAGEGFAAVHLAELLAERGYLEEAAQILRGPDDAGDEHAADLLADLLAMCGDLDGLRARVSVGHWHALELLEDLLIECGQDEEAQRLRRLGLNPDGSIACE